MKGVIQLLLTITCMGIVSSFPLAQGEVDQEGYRLQSPVRRPSEIFSAPTVPQPPPPTPAPARPVEQLYNTPQQQQRQPEQEPSGAQQPQILEQIPGANNRNTIGTPVVPSQQPSQQSSQMKGMPYEFEWSVNDVENGLVYSHQENSDGTVAQGEYRVLLPDGRLQIVTFEDRGQGYQAQVNYQEYAR